MYVTVSMRMPGRALGLTGGVLHLAHLVEVDERVEVVEGDARERATDREPLPFESVRGDRHAAHGAMARDRRIRFGDPRQDGDVVDGQCGHGLDSLVSRAW
jgi:hypothetical protein